jgi:adenosylhomocysteine nucleosidase
MKPIGILSALPEELSSIQKGSIEGIPVVTKLSGMGKVNAAIAAQKLVSEHRVKALIFTGVAGGLSPCLNIGDIVLATQTFEHDFGFNISGDTPY